MCMKINLRYAIVGIAALAIGFLVGRGTGQDAGLTDTGAYSRSSTFENDALGFLNWFRLMGRDEIPHEELVRNVQILESKAIASDKLLAFKGQKSKAEQGGADQPATAPESKSEGKRKSKPESKPRSQ